MTLSSHSMTSLSTQTFHQSSLFGFQKQSKRNHFILFLRLSKSCQCQIVPKPTQNFFSRNWQGDVGVGVVVHGNGAVGVGVVEIAVSDLPAVFHRHRTTYA